MLTHLQGFSRPEISMDIHQCARFSSNPKLTHECAVTRIGRCLLETIDRGLMCKVERVKGLKCFVDAYFAGDWNANDPLNATSVLSRTGHVITHSGLPTC